MTRALVLTLTIAFTTLAAPRVAAAQVSPYLSFSARLATDAGVPIDGSRAIRFAIYTTLDGGSPAWSEQADVTVRDGFAYHALGSTEPLTPALFRNGALYLEVAIGAEVFSPRLGLTSVPYARLAGEALLADDAHHAAEADHALAADDADTLGGLLATAFQRATTATCPAGSFVSAIAPSGTATCTAAPVATGDVTGVSTSPSSGLLGGASSGEVSLSIDPAQIQRRVATGCPTNSSIRTIRADGTVDCDLDTDTDTDTDTAAGRAFFSGCSWIRVGATSGNVSIFGTCPSGKYVVSGGCYGGNSGVTVRRSSPSPMPSDGAGPSATNGWYCAFSGVDGDNTLAALCCNYG